MPTSFGAGPRPQVQVRERGAEGTKPAAHGSPREPVRVHRARSLRCVLHIKCSDASFTL